VCVVVDLMCCCGASWIEWVGEVDGRALLLLPALLPPLTSGPVLYGGSIIHSQAMRPSELIFAAEAVDFSLKPTCDPPPQFLNLALLILCTCRRPWLMVMMMVMVMPG
jgi:hypothetical protein